MEPKYNRSILWDMGGLQRFERCIVRASPSGSSTATHNTRISGLIQKKLFVLAPVCTGQYGLLYYGIVRYTVVQYNLLCPLSHTYTTSHFWQN